jgi:hypothetical protein
MNDPIPDRPRRLVVALAVVALALAWTYMVGFSARVPWYGQFEANPPTLPDALALNTGLAPAGVREPGLPSSYLLALDWRAQTRLGSGPDSRLEALAKSTEPLAQIRALAERSRAHSRALVILLILAGGALACAVIPGWESGALAVALLSSSAGLLYHGLVTRSELLGCGFGVIGVSLGVWLGSTAGTWRQHHLWLFFAGVCGALAALTQPSGIFHLFVGGTWCWLAALVSPVQRAGRPQLIGGFLPVVSAVLLLLLAHQASVLGVTTAVTAERLRALAALAGLLPLAALWGEPGRIGRFLRDRACELALLAGGALAALVLVYAAVGSILPPEAALATWAGQLELFFYPRTFLENFVGAPAGVGHGVVRLVRESPFLFVAATALALTACALRDVPVRAKAFIGLLLASAFGVTWQLAHQPFTAAAGVGLEVPLLLVCAIALTAVGPWSRGGGSRPWLAPIVLVASAVLLATLPLRLGRISPAPASENRAIAGPTLQNLFDHPALPPAYHQMMKDHYGDRAGFERALEQYLARPTRGD